jgi:uncharacterized membrane protein
MAQPDFTSPPILRVATPKPKMTVYYALLIIALIAMLAACLLLYLEIRRFGGFGTVPQRIAAKDRVNVDGQVIAERMTNDQISMTKI